MLTILIRLFCLSALLLGSSRLSLAADISFSVRVIAKDDSVQVHLQNSGVDAAKGTRVVVELADRTYTVAPPMTVAPKEKRVFTTTVAFPKRPGSYPLITRVYYLNEGQELSLVNVGYFNYQTKNALRVATSFHDMRIRARARIFIPHKAEHRVRLILPDELRITEQEQRPDGTAFRVENDATRFSLNTTMYAVFETTDVSKPHGTAIVTARAKTVRIVKSNSFIPPWLFWASAVMALCGVLYGWRQWVDSGEQLTRTRISSLRWLFSVFVVSLLLALFHSLSFVADAVLPYVGPEVFPNTVAGRYGSLVVKTLFEWLYFDGGDYDYFARYIAVPLYLYMLLGNYFVLRYIIQPEPGKEKYWDLMRTFVSYFGLGRDGRGIYWSSLSKVAVLTLMVKAFYVPLLTSWMINDIYHQINLTNAFDWNFFRIQQYVVASLILIDVSVFAFGYLVELPQLKNQIRSVEPTVLGWVVCIMCYPPFNRFSFLPFDVPLNDTWAPPSDLERYGALTAIALLWGIYCWATIALGFKASNLTNRGVVSHGPYAYIRHPAYASKVCLWIVSSYFLGEKHFFLICALVAVYYLRAWTEERHLGLDPEYREYQKQVTARFIPGVI